MNERKINFLYNIEYKWRAGIVLTGDSILAIRSNRFNLHNAFVTIDKNREMWLQNIQLYTQNHTFKLLLKRNEINKIYGYYSIKNKVIIPFDLKRDKKYFKITIGIGTTKKEIDKREKIKERDMTRRLKSEE